ncbi:hypothetical protein [Parafilimonas sp.]|uniref:hypothetical protein n=1 Tax=Parafilimonas sp. TaxID=1969739 RepID=UPI0039E6FA5A
MLTEKEIRIRAFRAIDDSETCLRFIDGHKKVLTIYGITNVTTNTNQWMYNPAVFVVVVESIDGMKIYGGARIQCADGITPLPIEEAVGDMDSQIYSLVKHYAQFGTCELCGLWNSKEVAGLGIGSFMPAITAVAITKTIGLNILFSLCSPFTTRFKDWIGGVILTSIGNNGTFYYPKLDLIATVLFSDGLDQLPLTAPKIREKMIYLRENPKCIVKEKSPFKNMYVDVHYDLELKSANPNEFKIIIP